MIRLSKLAAPAAVIVLTACAGTPPAPSAPATVTVFAASSLTESFRALAAAFERATPGVSVTVNFGASSTLATQIREGAPADVFAAASLTTMDTALTGVTSAGPPAPFATNALAIATPLRPTVTISGLADLARADARVAVCQPKVPCGVAARELLEKNDVTVVPVTYEADVKAVMSKVELGEVDAGLVYETDLVAAGGRVTGITIPRSSNVTTRYLIVALETAQTATARAFVAYVLSPDGQSVLSAAGFGPP